MTFTAWVEEHGGIPMIEVGRVLQVNHELMAKLWGQWRTFGVHA